MILKKPYAFLIKHFRLIHLIMVTLATYIIIKTYNIYAFLGDYISSGSKILSSFEDVTGKYISSFLIIMVVIALLISIVVLYLMRHKKKPSFFYIFSTCVYLFLIALLIFGKSFIYDLQFTTPDLRFTKIVSDLFFIELALQIPIIVITFIRTIGFDVKKFDFKKDIMELDIKDEDNAEFEFELNLDTEETRAKIRRKVRYFKYYYKENKIIFYAFFAIIFLVSVYGVSKVISGVEKVYKENETFSTSYADITVLESYKTSLDNKANKISDKNFYMILKIRYKNTSSSRIKFLLDSTSINYDTYYNVSPTSLVYDKFLEFGTPYYSQRLSPNETRDFILVYEVDKQNYDKDFTFKYLYDIEVKNGTTTYKYKKVKLNPEDIDKNKVEEVDTKSLKEEMSFKGSLLKDTKLTINSMELSNSYVYNIIRCKNKVCNKYVNYLKPSVNNTYDLTILKLNYSVKMDESLDKGYSLSSFMSRYGSIRFVINDKEYEHKLNLKDITPYPTDGYVFLEVRERLNKAEKIYLDFTIRDKKYTYILLDKGESTPSEDENK